MKHVKKTVIIALVLLATLFSVKSYAQVKIAYVNSQDLLQDMPEAKQADTTLQKFANDLQQQLQEMQQEFQSKLKDFQDTTKTLSDAVKEVRTRELQDLQKRIQDFNSTARQRIDDKQQQLFAPILDKAKTAIKEVAKTKGYTYVLDNASGIVIQGPENDDLMAAVKQKLGIK